LHHGLAEAVKLLLASPDTAIDRPDYLDNPLYLAASGHHVDIMQYLLDRGAAPSGLGRTPLHAVCSSHRSNGESMQKCINLLLDAGCNINAVDDAKRTALHYLVDPHQPSDTNVQCCQLLNYCWRMALM
jgi:ankyrin repeat protein